jgi:NAD(P)-dependent dehydrogenase (short-subunit alcohol dehydrogenase family)
MTLSKASSLILRIDCLSAVSKPQGGAAIIQSAIDAWGRIDILVHNAGNVRYGSIAEMSLEDFNAVTDVHFKGGFYLVRAAMPHMIAAKYGRVVLTSSISGLYGSKTTVPYGMSRAGLMGLDTSLYPPLDSEFIAPMAA